MRLHHKRTAAGTVATLFVLAVISTPLSVLASSQDNHNKDTKTYSAHLEELNSSGVSGEAYLQYHEDKSIGDQHLTVSLNADGTTANQIHPVHIHGNANPEVALCPTNEQDANNDGFVSVVEGAAKYGPIKLNLTSPQTAFGTTPTPALFTSFAGTPDNNNLPIADSDGDIRLDQKYTFSDSEAAQGALASLMPLEDQHIVVHSADAPATVDADAFEALGAPRTGDLSAVSYDVLLPVACGEIQKTAADYHEDEDNHENDDEYEDGGQGDDKNADDLSAQAVDDFNDRIASLEQQYNADRQAAQVAFESRDLARSGEARDQYIGSVQKARDHYINQFHEARNQMVDQLNRTGDTELRNETAQDAEHELEQFATEFETMKNTFASRSD